MSGVGLGSGLKNRVWICVGVRLESRDQKGVKAKVLSGVGVGVGMGVGVGIGVNFRVGARGREGIRGTEVGSGVGVGWGVGVWLEVGARLRMMSGSGLTKDSQSQDLVSVRLKQSQESVQKWETACVLRHHVVLNVKLYYLLISPILKLNWR